MKTKLFLIGLVAFLASSWSMQKESEVELHVGYNRGCLERGVNVPITVKMPAELAKHKALFLSASGISLSKAGPSPDGGEWTYEEFIGRVGAGSGNEITISVSLRDRETDKITFLYKRSYISCGNTK